MSYKIHIYNHLVTNIVGAKSMVSCIVPCALEMSQCHTPNKVSMWALFLSTASYEFSFHHCENINIFIEEEILRKYLRLMGYKIISYT